jgi:hypothetical protein
VINADMARKLIRAFSEVLLALLMLMGCTVESSKSGEAGKSVSPGNHVPVIRSARIVPSPVVLNQLLSVQVDGFDSDGDLITYRHQWKINNSPETFPVLGSKILKRGDRISVTVIPYDGSADGVAFRAEAVVVNTPPEVTRLFFNPAVVRVGDRVQTQVEGSDADQDPIDYRFRWWRNNSEVADGDMSELDTTGFAKGDMIVVEATPSDQTSKGKSKLSAPMTIANSPPRITSAPPSIIERGRYVYSVTASDPDGDLLTYALEFSPPGMKIDKKTGRIEWPLSGKLAGSHKIRLTATDSEEAQAFQEFDVTLSMPAGSARKSFSKTLRLNTRLVSPFPALLE